jgi:hypothetical protein
MILRHKDILLKDEVELYNNFAQSGDCSGRLQAKLQVYPAPRILWEFESLGENACVPSPRQNGSIDSFAGHGFFYQGTFCRWKPEWRSSKNTA